MPPRLLHSGRARALLLLSVIALAVGSFMLGLYIGFEKQGEVGNLSLVGSLSQPPEGVDFAPLWKAWRYIEEKYVPATTTDPLTDEELLWGAIQGVAEATGDPYTVFFPPVEAEIFESDISGNFEGVGMEIGMQDDLLTVIAPLKGTPAERAGIRTGDKIIRIDGAFTERMTVDEAVQLIRGEQGTQVVLTIAREGEPELLEIPITRAVIEIPTLNTVRRDDGIFVIELYNFSAVSSQLFRNALREFIESGSTKLILDLRGNPGGYLEAAVDMASWFLPAGKVIVTEDYGENGEPKVHRSKGYDVFGGNFDMVVLVDGGSASASEILAGALKEHGIATVIGQSTFGKGSVQELLEVTSDTSIKITVARWVTPNGTSISDGGLKPDIEVERTAEDLAAGEDPPLARAVEFLLSN